MIEAESREQKVLDILQRQYEAEGLSFIRQPSPDKLPEFLKGMRPDALITGPRENIVVEIKASRRLHDRGKLTQMARLLESQPDWSFKIFYADDLSSSDETLPIPGKKSIDNTDSEIDELLSSNKTRSAFILAWALLEAVLRRQRNEAGPYPKSARSVAEFLEREGIVSPRDAKQLWQLADARNAIVHGDLDREVSKEDVQLLTRMVDSLYKATEPTFNNAGRAD